MPTTYVFFANCNDYWKADKYDRLSVKEMKELLQARNYEIGSITTKDKLRKCLHRTSLSQPSYLPLTNNDLRALLRNRRIPTNFGAGNIGQRCDLIAALEHADDNPRFPHFMRLPPELRARVYGYYFAGFAHKALHAPKQPPLTLTCRVARREALPLFYRSCVFAVNLVRGSPGSRQLAIPMEMMMWMHHTKRENLADIQRLKVRVWSRLRPSGALYSILHAEIGISKEEGVYLGGLGNWGFFEAKEITQIQRGLKEYLVLLRGSVAAGEKGGRKLREEDFFTIRRAMEMALEELG